MSGASFLFTDMGRALESLHCCGNNDPRDVEVCSCALGTCCCLGLSVASAAATASFYSLPLTPPLLFAPAAGECLGGAVGLSMNAVLCRSPTETEKKVARICCATLMCGTGIGAFGFFTPTSSIVNALQTGCIAETVHAGALAGGHLVSRGARHCLPTLFSRNENILEVALVPESVVMTDH